MSRTPLEDHFHLVEAEKAEQKLRGTLALFNSSGIGYIVEGGWAMAAIGSPTPSVDLDIMFRSEDYERLREHVLKTRGIQLETQGGLDALGIDWRFSDYPNKLFTKPGLYYVLDDFLRNRIQNGHIQTVGGTLGVRIPTPPALAIMKMKAFHDRRLQWEATRDPRAMAALDREDAAFVRSRNPAYWERKAGKDLYDIAFILRNHSAGVKDLLTDSPFDQAILDALRAPPAVLVAFAGEMARRSRVKIPDAAELHAALAR